MKDKRKTVVINSSGSMGMSVVGAIVEKFGYLSIPLRKLGLHDYLVGKRTQDDRFFQERVISSLKAANNLSRLGGISIRDRDKSKPRQSININLISNEINYITNNKFKDIYSLYDYSREAYAKALSYKTSYHKPFHHIEFTSDIEKYDPVKLFESYQREFGDVRYITLHREFVSWLDSLLATRFTSPRFKTKYYFALHSGFNQFSKYENVASQLPGLHLNFEDLFLPNTDNIFKKISNFLDEDRSIKNEEYDLFGKLMSYNRAFTQVDKPGKNFSKLSIYVINRLLKKERLGILDSVIFYPFYLIDAYKYTRNSSST